MKNQCSHIVTKAGISDLLINYFRVIDEKHLDAKVIKKFPKCKSNLADKLPVLCYSHSVWRQAIVFLFQFARYNPDSFKWQFAFKIFIQLFIVI